jgi:DNA-binding MarR family transcriptional regulator
VVTKPGSRRIFLEDLSAELSALSAMLALYAEQEAQRREASARDRVTPAQVQAMVAARHARSAVFGMDLANPGWSLLLELFRAYLEQRPVRLARLATDARVAATTATRWVEQFIAAGFVRREADGERQGGIMLALTDAGTDALEDYFVALQLGWVEADPPKRGLQTSI